ncbi:hypothetical protein HELRODRAFT_179333 [Helobdella robusta]|uniref:Cyclin-dependent kinase inhibitor domain-containing protein n=1 Tax=Helobdella robusta TaxID=6412 RepID=T1FEK3_HELRO|nr:hypothetical protein HELRODRAFT_179333 [Helobdella robusta]ESN95556.1 hypothetical protein HELRODRAFT_179333 [Helobdella robusta]
MQRANRTCLRRVTYGTITVTRGEACDVSESIGASSSSGYGISSSDSSSSNISVEPISSSGTPSNLGQSEHRLPPTPKKTLKRKKIQAASSRANPVTARRKLNFDSATGQSSTPTLPPPVASASAPTETSTAAGLSSITTSGPSFSSSSTPIGELFESDQKYNSKKYNFDFKEGKPLAGENYKWSSNRVLLILLLHLIRAQCTVSEGLGWALPLKSSTLAKIEKISFSVLSVECGILCF